MAHSLLHSFTLAVFCMAFRQIMQILKEKAEHLNKFLAYFCSSYMAFAVLYTGHLCHPYIEIVPTLCQ